eukprot:6195372-Pleurochrysis_carterae.AAC.1
MQEKFRTLALHHCYGGVVTIEVAYLANLFPTVKDDAQLADALARVDRWSIRCYVAMHAAAVVHSNAYNMRG